MALKDLSSLYDLVGGTQPVGDMEDISGGPQFDLGNTSTLQQDSLLNIPVDSPYQDLNGEPGPQFDLGEDSMLQQNSLLSIPDASEYQDLNGVNGPSFDLGTTSTLQQDSLPNIPIQSQYQDLNGETPSQYLDNLPQ